MSAPDPEGLEQARALLAGARRIVVFTGAGVSAESGIPTFRDALERMWARFDPERLATEASSRTITVVTQNVDGLHPRAGSRDAVELHGSIVRAKCLEGCGLAPAGWEHDARVPPPCAHCGAPLRPDVVWFGEMLPPGAFERAERFAAEADAMRVVGTTGLVQPAASLLRAAVRHRRPVIAVDPNPTELDRLATVALRGSAVSVVPSILPTAPPPPPARGAAAP